MNVNRFDKLTAEAAYLFRHALMRDAAYQLQAPSDRARLHLLAADLLEELARDRTDLLESWAAEIAAQLRMARFDPAAARWPEREKRLLLLAAGKAGRQHRLVEALEAWQRVVELDPSPENLLRAGSAADDAGRFKEAEQWLKNACRSAEAAGNLRTKRDALRELAAVHRNTGDMDAALVAIRHAMAVEGGKPLPRELGDLATLLMFTGQYAEAEPLLLGALVEARATRNRALEAALLNNICGVYRATGKLADAIASTKAALAIARERGDRAREAVFLGNLALFSGEAGLPEDAYAAWREALAIDREVGSVYDEGLDLSNLAGQLTNDGRHDEARPLFMRALEILREIGARRSEGIVIGELANLDLNCGRYEEALAGFSAAVKIHRTTRNRHHEAVHECGASLSLIRLGRYAEARTMWKSASEVFVAIGEVAELADRAASMRQECARAGVPPLDAGAP